MSDCFSAKWTRWADCMCSEPVMAHIKREFMDMFGYDEWPQPDSVYDAGCGLGR